MGVSSRNSAFYNGDFQRQAIPIIRLRTQCFLASLLWHCLSAWFYECDESETRPFSHKYANNPPPNRPNIPLIISHFVPVTTSSNMKAMYSSCFLIFASTVLCHGIISSPRPCCRTSHDISMRIFSRSSRYLRQHKSCRRNAGSSGSNCKLQ